jgi:Fe-S-cluster containining protein
MIPSLMDLLWGCTHVRLTFPRKHAMLGCDYVCCLTCGDEYEYDFRSMKVRDKLPRTEHLKRFADSYTGNLITELTEQVERTR